MVSWAEQVLNNFDLVGQMETPWRWEYQNERLGNWLAHVRRKIILGEEIDLSSAPLRCFDFEDDGQEMEIKRRECYRMLNYQGQSTVVIASIENKCHHLAARLGGHFCSMEPIQCKDLFEAAGRFQGSKGNNLAVAIIDFAAKCLTKVRTELKTVREKLDQGASLDRVRKHGKIKDVLTLAARTCDVRDVDRALEVIREDVNGNVLFPPRWRN